MTKSSDAPAILQNAIGTGEMITIIYNGGHAPGTRRQIVPFRVNGSRLMARDINSSAIKSFSLSKIEIAPPESNVPWARDVPVNRPVHFTGLKDAHAALVHRFQQLGWRVEFSQDDINLYGRFRNGKARKTPSAGVGYKGEGVVDLRDDNGDTLIFSLGNVSRPWYVFGPGLQKAHTFEKLDNALALLCEQAEQHAPGQEV